MLFKRDSNFISDLSWLAMLSFVTHFLFVIPVLASNPTTESGAAFSRYSQFSEYVQLFNGAATHTRPIFTFNLLGGKKVPVTFLYSSNIKHLVRGDSRIAPTGWTGLGWHLASGSIKCEHNNTRTIADDKFTHISAQGYESKILKKNGEYYLEYFPDIKLTPITIPGDDDYIIGWTMIEADGTKLTYGTNMYPGNESIRYTFCWGEWYIGEVSNTAQVLNETEHFPYQWDLTEVKEPEGDAVWFKYSQVQEGLKVLGTGANSAHASPPRVYTKASYLYQIGNDKIGTIQFNRTPKASVEYYDPYNYSSDYPDADYFQEFYETDLLDEIVITNPGGTVLRTIDIEYDKIAAIDNNDFIKSVIKAITEYDGAGKLIDRTDYLYYNDRDNTSYNYNFGALKQMISLNGGIINFEYSKIDVPFATSIQIPYTRRTESTAQDYLGEPILATGNTSDGLHFACIADGDGLRVYNWDGMDWVQHTEVPQVLFGGTGIDTAVASKDYFAVMSKNKELKVFQWNYTDWELSLNDTTIQPDSLKAAPGMIACTDPVNTPSSYWRGICFLVWDGDEWKKANDVIYDYDWVSYNNYGSRNNTFAIGAGGKIGLFSWQGDDRGLEVQEVGNTGVNSLSMVGPTLCIWSDIGTYEREVWNWNGYEMVLSRGIYTPSNPPYTTNVAGHNATVEIDPNFTHVFRWNGEQWLDIGNMGGRDDDIELFNVTPQYAGYSIKEYGEDYQYIFNFNNDGSWVQEFRGKRSFVTPTPPGFKKDLTSVPNIALDNMLVTFQVGYSLFPDLVAYVWNGGIWTEKRYTFPSMNFSATNNCIISSNTKTDEVYLWTRFEDEFEKTTAEVFAVSKVTMSPRFQGADIVVDYEYEASSATYDTRFKCAKFNKVSASRANRGKNIEYYFNGTAHNGQDLIPDSKKKDGFVYKKEVLNESGQIVKSIENSYTVNEHASWPSGIFSIIKTGNITTNAGVALEETVNQFDYRNSLPEEVMVKNSDGKIRESQVRFAFKDPNYSSGNTNMGLSGAHILDASCQSTKILKETESGPSYVVSSRATTFAYQEECEKILPKSIYQWKVDMTSDGKPDPLKPFADFDHTPGAENLNWHFIQEFTKYNSTGQVIESKNARGTYSTIFYGQNGEPVATARNARHGSCIFTNWSDLEPEFINYVQVEMCTAPAEILSVGRTVKLTTDESNSGADQFAVAGNTPLNSSLAAIGGNSYEIQFWAKADREVNTLIYIQAMPGLTFSDVEKFNVTTEWKKYEFTVRFPFRIQSGEVLTDKQYRLIIRPPGDFGNWVQGCIYYSDLRVYPKGALMETVYYEQLFHKPVLTFDANNNIGRLVKFDGAGRPVEWYKVDNTNPDMKIPIQKKEYFNSEELPAGKKIQLLLPVGGEFYSDMVKPVIRWVSDNVSRTVRIYYKYNNGGTWGPWQLLHEVLNANGYKSFEWSTVPDFFSDTECLFRVEALDGGGAVEDFDESANSAIVNAINTPPFPTLGTYMSVSQDESVSNVDHVDVTLTWECSGPGAPGNGECDHDGDPVNCHVFVEGLGYIGRDIPISQGTPQVLNFEIHSHHWKATPYTWHVETDDGKMLTVGSEQSFICDPPSSNVEMTHIFHHIATTTPDIVSEGGVFLEGATVSISAAPTVTCIDFPNPGGNIWAFDHWQTSIPCNIGDPTNHNTTIVVPASNVTIQPVYTCCLPPWP